MMETCSFDLGDLVEAIPGMGPRTIYDDEVVGDNVEGYIWPEDRFVVVDLGGRSRSVQIMNMQTGLRGWISKNVIQKVSV